MRRPSFVPLNTPPFRNCAEVQAEAMVLNSLTTTLFGGVPPSTASNAMASFGPLSAATFGVPPLAMT